MRFSKPCQILLLFLMVALLSFSVSAQSYLPSDFGSDYPIVFHWEQSDAVNAHVAKRTGTASFTDLSKFEKPYSIGPPGDYDGDDNIEYPVRSQNGGPYLKFYTDSGSQDFSVSLKPKTGSMLAAGYLDKDGKTDLLFKNQNGYMSAVDSDGESKEYQISSFGDPIDVADIDKDGKKEILYSDSSANVKYYDIESSSSTNIDPGNDKANSYSNLADVDSDGLLEYSYATGSSTVYTADRNGKDKQVGSLTSAKVTPQAIFYDGSELKFFVAGNSNNVKVCTLSSCNPADRKSSGARSVIPPLTDTPQLNISDGTVTQGKTVSVRFNATDYEGYSDILNSEASVTFTDPSAGTNSVSASEITSVSGVTGTTSNNNFVPDDGKTKTFEAVFNLPDSAETGQWNATVQVKDEKMTGTLNFSTFEVEKALIEKNVTQNISMSRKDTSRQTSLGKSQITGLSYASAGLSNSFTKRLLTESLGFSSGKDRKQRLKKGVSSSVGVSRSVSNFKASFPIFSSVFSAGSVISDVYATEKSIQDFLDISDTTSDEALFTGAVQDGFGLQTSQGKGIAQRLLELALGVSSEEERSVGLNRSSQEVLSLGSSESPALSFGRVFVDNLVLAPQNRVQQDVLRLLSESIGFDLFGTRDQSIRRLDNNTITGSSSFSRTSDTTRLILEAFSQDSTFSRFDFSATRLLSQSFSTSGRFGEPLATGLVNIALGVDQSFERSSTVLGRILLSDFLASDSPIGELTSVRGSNQTLAAGNGVGATGLFFGSSAQNLGVEQSIRSLPNFIVSVTQLLQSDGSQSSSILLQRSSDLNLNLSNSNSRSILVLRSFSSGLSASFTPGAFGGTITVVQQLIGLSSGETDTLVSPRTQDTGIGVSSGISESQTVFRSFTQSLIASTAPSFLEGFIDDLIDGACGIFGQDSTFCDSPGDNEDSSPSDDSDDGSGGGGGGGIGNIGDQNQTQALDNGTESPNNMTQDKDAANGENVSLSDTNRSSSISVNVSLESENNSKPSVQLENVSSGEKVSLNIQERPRDESQTSKPSQDLETAEDESVELEAVSFQVEEKSEDSAINVTTVENSSKLNITSENKIYKATEVSTDVETDNAELIYNVQKSFLSQNNATKNDLVVNRWKNSSRIQTLPTELLNESASNLTVKAASPNGFSIFTVGLKNTTSDASVTSREFSFEYTFPNIQLVKLFKAILILSSLYLIRYPLLKTLFTLDIRLSYIIEGVHVRVLELRRRLRWWLDAGEGREEFGLAGDVNSLRNKKEALQFKKKRLEKEVKRKKELRNRYLMRLELLTNKVEKWREKLEG